MKPENTFIAPPIIQLREKIKNLGTALEVRPKVPGNLTGEASLLLNRYVDFTVRLGAVLDSYEMELDKMLDAL